LSRAKKFVLRTLPETVKGSRDNILKETGKELFEKAKEKAGDLKQRVGEVRSCRRRHPAAVCGF
jgi:hypothetical protein